ncbi:MAG: TetR/AcrR family transcriptional regulator [Planctomycetota bacterium]
MATLSKQRRRAEILESAQAVFGEKGYHRAKVEDIVKRAGVARGTFYLYFDNKRATFDEILDGLFQRLRTAIQPLDPAAPFRAQIHANVTRVLSVLLAERGLTKILLSHAVGVDIQLDRKLLSFYDAIAELMEGALSLGQRLGICRHGDARLLSYALLGAIKEIVYRVVVAGYERDHAAIAEEILDQSLYGVLVRGDVPEVVA